MDGVAFRVDAGEGIGTGHLVRCLTLADALARRGAPAHFFTRGLSPALRALVETHGHELTPLETGASGGTAPDDLAATRRALEQAPWSWIVVDHYDLDRAWEDGVRGFGRVMAIDDLANRPHACDVLLDQNLVAGASSRYAGLIPETCGSLLGPTYALLQPQYAELHDRVPPREGPVERILISFGGFDPDLLTERALDAVLGAGSPEIDIDVVIADEPRAAALERRHPDGRVHVFRRVPTLAPLMARADLAIGAAGSTTWERLCLGLPSLIVTFADNQTPIADELQRRGLARWLGASPDVDAAAFARALEPIVSEGLDPEWSRRSAAEVDGRGTLRVCDLMTASSATNLRVRPVAADDESLLLEWANDPVTRRSAFAPEPISSATHHAWFHGRLRELDTCRFYIVETDAGMPIGQVRFQQHEGRWELHYAVAPAFRSRGLGGRVLDAALRAFRNSGAAATVFGQVQLANERSRRIFEGLGFRKLAASGTSGSVVYERTL
jgi:UDP-2,4-diacetamido-2,4,6-trideoxy-beta-L-altropyranose hydrolase